MRWEGEPLLTRRGVMPTNMSRSLSYSRACGLWARSPIPEAIRKSAGPPRDDHRPRPVPALISVLHRPKVVLSHGWSRCQQSCKCHNRGCGNREFTHRLPPQLPNPLWVELILRKQYTAKIINKSTRNLLKYLAYKNFIIMTYLAPSFAS
jgi:hypothetical protein